ncbi:MAG: efflux RND transporter periplasmic adaptor subunit [bacterium]|nr:efflux RND transporter periplasmic adaptor subunit [bacterium]
MINFFKKPIGIIAIIILIGLIAGGYFYFGREKKTEFDVVVAKRSDLIQEVSVTGRVKPARSVELAFEKSGKISAVYADVGKQVSAGQTLVVLENAEFLAQLKQAEANVKFEQAKLDELKRGARSEDIEVQLVKVKNYEVALKDAKKNAVDKLQDAYTRSDNAVRNDVDQFFLNPRSSSPQLRFLVLDSQLEIDTKNQRIIVEAALVSWRASLDLITIESDLAVLLVELKSNLALVRSFLSNAASALNNGAPLGSGTSFADISSWKIDVFSARTSVNTAVSNITGAEKDLQSAESDLTLAKQELVLKEAGTVPEQILAQEAKVESAVANVENLQAQISKTIIRAPINGVVTKQDAKIGEIISANTVIVSLISASQFEIEANVPEADIAKLKIGNTAKITLDAYGNDINFNVKVVAIDPAETIIDGVATYKTTFQFTEKDERIKSGMTVNIDISTEKREGVIVIPQRAIITKNGDKLVRILNTEAPKEVKVKIGLRGSDGNIEIIEGVNEGDKVIIFFE